jgi:DNA-binding PadR family transcriptional regulator
MATDPRDLLPLKPLVFQVLLALSDGERHGWSLVRDVQQRTGGARVLPANFYRTLRGMLADGLIQEATSNVELRTSNQKPGDQLERRRYFKLTALGREAGRFEARRLQELVADSRTKRLLARNR